MTHLTAGSIKPLAYKAETVYGTPTGSAGYYADLAGQSGSFTPTDTNTPYIAWRSGNRSYDRGDHVEQQVLAGYKAVLEVRDTANWPNILGNVLGANTGTSPLGGVPSRTVQLATADGGTITYNGCKTDELTIRADAPGAVAVFEETVMAKRPSYIDTALTPTIPTAPAVQWLGPVTMGSSTVYPQRLAFTVRNHSERVLGWDGTNDEANTVAIVEGRRDIELELTLWREDLARIGEAAFSGEMASATFRLGAINEKLITLSGVAYVSDGTISPILQDKQTETIRLRANGVTVATPSP